MLELKATATDKQIRSSYRRLVKTWHPDRFETDASARADAEEKLKAINQAYRTLQEKGAKGWRKARRAGTGNPRFSLALFRPLRSILRSAALILIMAILFFRPIDSFLAGNDAAGGFYIAIRDAAATRLHAIGRQLRRVTGRDPGVEGSASAESGASTQGESNKRANERPAFASRTTTRAAATAPPGSPSYTYPFITLGLTQQEVEQVAGAPDTISTGRMVYGASELNFTNGKLSGWKIAPGSSLPVKLWPNAPVDPDLEFFTLGSSRSEVLAVQGTPDLYSGNAFGYGGSKIYFQNGVVSGWMQAPGSPPLRVEH